MEASRSARVAAQRLAKHERYLHHLRAALRTRLDNGFPADKLGDVVKQAEDEIQNLVASVGGRIVGRRHPPSVARPETCTVYIDECGDHALKSKDRFKAFCLAAVLIRDSDYPAVDRRWRRWKHSYLGSEHKKVHEPDIRREEKSFWCGGDLLKRQKAVAALDGVLEELDFTAIACIINRPAYAAEFGKQPLDESLPEHAYLMMTHFLLERAAMALSFNYGGARGRLVIESRGPKEDAMMQYEFARLFLDGTSYVSATWFRSQFLPGIAFYDKGENCTGLQLADLVARPCGEKVLTPESTPARWSAVRQKLCLGMETKNSILGLKIVPWNPKYERLWEKAEGTAYAIPPAD